MSVNGRLPASELAPIKGGTYLRRDAAAAWNAMYDFILAETGERIGTNGSDSAYRTYARQVYWRSWWCARGACGNAATPGTSNHGWGLAVDVPPRTRALIDRYGERFGWAKRFSDAPFESWHLKWRAGIWSPAVDPLAALTATERDAARKVLAWRAKRDKTTDRAARARLNELIARRKEQIRGELMPAIRAAARESGWKKADRAERYRALKATYGPPFT